MIRPIRPLRLISLIAALLLTAYSLPLTAFSQPTPTPTNTSVTANKTTGVIVAPVDLATFKTANDLAAASDTTSALAGKQPLDSDLTSIAALTTTETGRYPLTNTSRPATAITAGVSALDLSFRRVRVERLWDPMPEALLVYDTNFTANGGTTGEWDITSAPEASFAAGYMQFATAATGNYAWPKIANLYGPSLAVQATISQNANSGYVGIGFGKPTVSQNKIVVFYDYAQSKVVLQEVFANGSSVAQDGTTSLVIAGVFKIMATLSNNRVACYIDRGNSWEQMGQWALSEWDTSDPTVYNTGFFLPIIQCRATSSAWRLSNFKVGYHGTTGIGNQNYVKYEDGTPIFDAAGNYFLIATANAPTSVMTGFDRYRQMHNMIVRVNPTTLAATIVGNLQLLRDGRYHNGDVSGSLIYDRTASLWRFLAGSFSDFGTETLRTIHYTSRENLLAPGMHIMSDSTELVGLGYGCWDMDAVLIAGTWYAAYAEYDSGGSTFYITLDSGPSLSSLTRLAKDLVRAGPLEGPRIVKIGGNTRIFSSSSAGIYVWDIALSYLGQITMPAWPVGLPRQHAAIIPIPKGDGMRWLIDTFDQTTDTSGGPGTYGSRIVYEATNTQVGNDYAPGVLPPNR